MKFIYPAKRTPEPNIGDAVQLSAGGPVMTVYDRLPGDWICCNYLKGTGMFLMAVPADSVVRVERLQRKPA